MAFLTLDGVTVEVQHDGAEELEPFDVGDFERAMSGAMRVSVRERKREWQFESGPMTDAEIATLEAAVGLMDLIPIAGDAIDGGSINGHARITRRRYIPNDLTHLRVLSISVFEA